MFYDENPQLASSVMKPARPGCSTYDALIHQIILLHEKQCSITIVCITDLTTSMSTNAIHPLAEPLLVSFEQTVYAVLETAGRLEVCVILTRPDTDIFEHVVGVEVFGEWFIEANEYIPSGATIASKFQ